MNEYVKQYIKFKAQNDRAYEEIQMLSYVVGNGKLRISPKHFNNFYFEVDNYETKFPLEISEARELGQWLLKVTEGIEDTFSISAEIEIEKLKLKA